MAIFLILIVIAIAYNEYTSNTLEKDYGYKVETSRVTQKPNCESLQPHNPFDNDSRHFAGYEWGAEGKKCGGRSEPFIEGCQEYENQENAYNYCLDRNK